MLSGAESSNPMRVLTFLPFLFYFYFGSTTAQSQEWKMRHIIRVLELSFLLNDYFQSASTSLTPKYRNPGAPLARQQRPPHHLPERDRLAQLQDTVHSSVQVPAVQLPDRPAGLAPSNVKFFGRERTATDLCQRKARAIIASCAFPSFSYVTE